MPRFPSLAVLIAGGAIVPACQAPVCGTTRAEELEQHGPQGVREAANGNPSEALREVGRALGVVGHRPTTVPDLTPAGAAPPVMPTPPTPPTTPEPPPMVGGGAAVQVTPQPPPATPHATTHAAPHPPPATHHSRGGAIAVATPF